MSTTEKITFLVDAEDRATAKVRQATQAVEQNVEKVKALGGQAKSSADMVGTLANSMGDSAFGSYAGEIGSITERIREFSEGAKAGGIQGRIFKATLAGIAGVAAFKLTSALSGADQANRKLTEGLEKSKELLDETFSARDAFAADQQRRLSLISDPEKQREELQRLLSEAKKNMMGAGNAAADAREQFDGFNTTFRSWTGNKQLKLFKEQADQASQSSRDMAKRFHDLTRQLNEFDEAQAAAKENEMTAAMEANKATVTQSINALQERARWLGKTADQLEIIKLREAGAKDETIKHAKALQAQIKAFSDKEKAAKAAADEERERLDQQKRAAQLQQAEQQKRQSFIDGLKLQVTALRDGEQAAAAMRLEMQGFGKDQASRIASLQAKINDLKSKPKAQELGKLSTTDSRLLSGRGQIVRRDQQADAIKASQKSRDAKLDNLTTLMAEVVTNTAQSGGTLKVVGD